MSKHKKSGKVDSQTSKLNLTAAIVNLITALLLLIEQISR